MKNLALILIAVAGVVLWSSAQEISRSVIATSGKYHENSGYSLSSTVGEPMTKTFSSGGYTLTQGFQQPDDGCQRQEIIINTGWNMISSYIIPDEPDMEAVFGNISSDILLVKDVSGATYIPSFNINTIGDWDVAQGYKVKASSNTVLTLGCTQVDPLTTPISLAAGWNMFAYLRTSNIDITTALAGIEADILLVKDVAGNTYIPSFSINTIGDMEPGQGYKAKMANAVSLTYPANAKTSRESNYVLSQSPSHYRLDLNTGHNATIIIPAESAGELVAGDEVGVFGKNGKLAGAAFYEGRNLAITVWGDDPTTDEIESIKTGDELMFKIWNEAKPEERTVAVEYEEGDGYYQNDGIYVLKKMETAPATGISLSCYPNPTTGIIFFDIKLAEKSKVALKVYDGLGRILTHVNKTLEAGNHRLNFNGASLADGIYLYKAKISGHDQSGSFVISR